MRKILSLAAAVASVFAVGAAQADVILIDDFNSGSTPPLVFQRAADALGNDGIGVYSGVSAIAGSPLPQIATQRDLYNEIQTAGVVGTGFSKISAGSAPNFTPNALNISNDPGVDSVNKVIWTLGSIPSGALLGPVSFLFNVIVDDKGGTANAPITLSFDMNGTSFSSTFTLNGTLGLVPFALSAADVALFAAVGPKTLTMTINGDANYDLTLDSFGLQIPEPTTLALVGLALVGAGAVSRRRKA